MRRVFGPRTVVEAGVLVAVPVATAAIGSGIVTIIVASAAACAVVLALELTVLRGRRRPGASDRGRPAFAGPVGSEPATFAPEVGEHVRVIATGEPSQPEASTEAEVAQRERPRLAAVASSSAFDAVTLPLEGEADEAEESPWDGTVVPIGWSSRPQTWNLWDLERLTRENTGPNPFRDEERTFLLMYLRDFAGPDGLLPIDFDALVRDSFGDLVSAT